ncbi:MAG: hypothetical protein NVS1B4_06090 [Gemmatimonadaceae bacterium]
MTSPKLVTLSIEGRRAVVPEGTSILEAAKSVGVLVPHYCYHPSLPVAGVCRMCLVEVEKQPKLAPSCATAVAEGQVVHVHSGRATDARKGVLEMLLINHPLDCPICDQSGECELQDYTYREGRADSRYHEPKRFNPVEDFGGDVVYVPNRCILCTRCVRFMDDVAHEATLNVSERGDRALIGTFPGAELTHPWAGNVIELCPVGALLSKDSLNKVRSWEVDRTASVCPGCTQGCNMTIETRDNVVVRLRPRANDAVNKSFLCDQGRLDYRWMNRRDRLTTPMVRRDDALETTDWETGMDEAASLLRGRRAFAVVSPNLSNEALYLLGELVRLTGGAGRFRVEIGPEAPLDGVPGLALRAERAANVRGAELAGFVRADDPLRDMRDGDVLVIADEALTDRDTESVRRAAHLLVVGTTLPLWAAGAAVVLPTSNLAEEDGTFTNVDGRVQRFLQAKAAPGDARPSFFVISDLVTALGGRAGYFLAADAFAALAASHPSYRGLTYENLALRGRVVGRDAPSSASGQC